LDLVGSQSTMMRGW